MLSGMFFLEDLDLISVRLLLDDEGESEEVEEVRPRAFLIRARKGIAAELESCKQKYARYA